MSKSSDVLAGDALTALANGLNRDPFAVLGPHPDERGRGVLVRAFQPAARSVDIRIVETGELRPMVRRAPAGIYEIVVEPLEPLEPREPFEPLDYRLRITFPGDHVIEIDDPYRYGRVLTDFELHFFGEGTHLRI